MFISVPIIVRNAVKLKYPLDRVVESVVGFADEIVISVDPTSEDDSVDYVYDIVLDINNRARRKLVRWFESPWNLHNINSSGTEFSIQTNRSIDQCRGDWVFVLQADEALHEKDHSLLRMAADLAGSRNVTAFSTTRIYFYGDIDTVREDWTVPIVRFFKKGSRRSCDDAMNTSGAGVVEDLNVPIYHYSRIGDPEIISRRILSLDSLFHDKSKLLSERDLKPYDFSTHNFDCMHKKNVDVGRKEVEATFKRFVGKHPSPFVGYTGK